ncbi:nucleoside-diphosphate-sugar epimerase [Desulfosalsimonas propionicica]|uniref:Nucleoside-diphosphate-sugar epimerase n=1 Tax=Desulfosalsimonas propionicica TaxID=332175 RepID=A0A7W0C985_9BACT|nr:NAD-dependent epimerase/dehydratase family protein [Desulfosalsimonas propionicica]MBA2881482.1 nucleoside-diphosphate-sugar epimerase [Desulfosalsimonas propionicica]
MIQICVPVQNKIFLSDFQVIMRILVLGGTGAMGAHLVDILSQNGSELFVTSRSPQKSKSSVSYLQGNAKDFVFFKELVGAKWDIIVDFMVYSTEDFKKRINLILDATVQYFFISSARVYANSLQHLTEDSARLLDVSEDKEYLLTDEYALSKARQEDMLINSGRKNWTIVRPYITYSENRLQLGNLEKEQWLYRALKGRTIVFSKDIASKRTAMTYGRDVSKSISSLIGDPRAYGNIYNITTNETRTWAEIMAHYLTIIDNQLDFKPKVLLQSINQVFELHPAKYQIKYDRLYNRQFDNSKIGEFIDVESFTQMENGIEKSLTAFIKKPDFRRINWVTEALQDKQAKETTPLKEISGLRQKAIYLIYRHLSAKHIKILKKLKT